MLQKTLEIIIAYQTRYLAKYPEDATKITAIHTVDNCVGFVYDDGNHRYALIDDNTFKVMDNNGTITFECNLSMRKKAIF